MATQLKISGPASALLALAALLAVGARADDVTTAECSARGVFERVRLYPDINATTLAIYSCGLTKIDPDAFKGLPKLDTISLEFNDIENLNPAAFHTVPALTRLHLQANQLRDLPVFDERSCSNMTELLLNSNKLRAIDDDETFSACVKLQRLSLCYNGIEFIRRNVFSALTDLRILDLNNNKIRLIPDQMFTSNGKLEWLHIQNNLITHLPPDFASSLKRTSAGFDNIWFYGNPWHCACLLELLADVQRAGVSDYRQEWWGHIIHYEGTLLECNYISMREYPCSKIRELNFIVHGVR